MYTQGICMLFIWKSSNFCPLLLLCLLCRLYCHTSGRYASPSYCYPSNAALSPCTILMRVLHCKNIRKVQHSTATIILMHIFHLFVIYMGANKQDFTILLTIEPHDSCYILKRSTFSAWNSEVMFCLKITVIPILWNTSIKVTLLVPAGKMLIKSL